MFSSSRELWSMLFQEEIPAWFEAHTLTDVTARRGICRWRYQGTRQAPRGRFGVGNREARRSRSECCSRRHDPRRVDRHVNNALRVARHPSEPRSTCRFKHLASSLPQILRKSWVNRTLGRARTTRAAREISLCRA